MKDPRLTYRFYIVTRGTAFFMLFLLDCAFVFAALGLFTLGIAVLPCVMLGIGEKLIVMTDLDTLPLILISTGVLLTGAGLCVLSLLICPSSFSLFLRFLKTAQIRADKIYEEESD